MSNLTAETILKQLGGRRFVAMTGSHSFLDLGNGLSCKLRRNKAGVNYMRIKLNALDLYDIEFLSVRKSSIKTKREFNDIYNDQLQDIFTDVTGLYTKF